MRRTSLALLALLLLLARPIVEDEPDSIVREGWNYAPAMKSVARRFAGREGVVIHVGDSMTLAPEYGEWPLRGEGKTKEDRSILNWMRAGERNDLDGWFLAAGDPSMRGPSRTACGGIRTDEMLRGGKLNLASLAEMLDRYRPRIVVLLLGTNDIDAGRPVKNYQNDINKCVDLILGRGTICVLTTVPPYPGRVDDSTAYNEALRSIARARKLPLIDFEREILSRRPDDWNGTLLARDDVHPSGARAGVTLESTPTKRALGESGYLLRGWLTVRKIAEIKKRVIDDL